MQIQYLNEYKNNNSKLKKKILTVFILLFILFILALISYLSYLGIKAISNSSNIGKQYKKMFADKNYLKLIENMDKELLKRPFDQEYLTLRGYSYFLMSEEEGNSTKKRIFLTSALVDLRRVLALNNEHKIDNNILFVLGKIYYYLGEPYYKQSVLFLRKALENGNSRPDLFYLLGLIYTFTGEYNESIKVFQNALKIEESDVLLLVLANSYYKLNDYNNAKLYLNSILKSSKDEKVKEKSYLILSEMAFTENDLDNSLNYANKVLELNNNNAAAYFYRGEIYYKLNNLVKARAEWRKTLEIEPSHIKALKRIYN